MSVDADIVFSNFGSLSFDNRLSLNDVESFGHVISYTQRSACKLHEYVALVSDLATVKIHSSVESSCGSVDFGSRARPR